ncbi:hypothetical protein ACVIHI_005781 [Bradyrhizobium sp. USDA 4524]|uniref:hypothetical protein n=1 Tax=unclassified Bradyrhizobium TaxID=2631580 RepID=UPI00209CE29D|nr:MULTISPECIES: hypothetical protein [unclassified Bradyrhizobium]MCP1841298.1 hypothetical protein [Bradyrhizobium sp. USDA 4538]MCP1901861.1 hypothetical protein [Bradyrhizobium sp. USDA 4537]MCP1992482.1 hypothetical protein [Bradyrhizobium sp. USDA 4539]
MGLSRREFAKAEGCSEGAVRYALRQRRLVAKPDGTLDPSQLGGGWLRNYRPKSKGRAKSAQVAEVTQPCAEIPPDVAHYHGWDFPEFNEETTNAMGVFLPIGDACRKDLETIGISAAGYGSSLLDREAYKLGWRGGGDPPADVGLSGMDDAASIGPEAEMDDLNAQSLTFGLVRRFGRAMAPDDPEDEDAVPLDISDPIAVASRMIHLAVHFYMEDLKRRRRAAGIASPRDSR